MDELQALTPARLDVDEYKQRLDTIGNELGLHVRQQHHWGERGEE